MPDMHLLKAKKERIPQYDLIRAVAMFLVVYVHSSFMFNFAPASDSKQAGLYWFTSILALVCNGLFFMVSGKFNLAQATKLETGGYRTFYTKKVIDLLVPVVFYAIAFWVLRFVGIKLFGAWDDGTSFLDYGAFFKTTYHLLISSWWFVPTLFSLMIFTPFLGRMLSSLNRKEAYVLLAFLFGCAAIIAIENLIGYKKYVAAGVSIVIFGLVFVLSPQQVLSSSGDTLPVWKDILSAVFFPVVATALFLFFKNIKITGDKAKKVIEFVGNRSYGIYLIQFCFFFSFLHLLPEWLRGSDNVVDGIAKRLAITMIVYILSLAVATLVDLLVVNPIQKRLKILLLK